jgi:uncharacterized protein YybS (DUF2232 family)
MNQSKQITDGALLTGIFIILLLITMFLPGAIIAAVFLLPVPFVLYTSRHDWKPSLLMFAAAVILTLLFATYISLPLTLLAGIAGIMTGSAIHRGLTPYETWGRGAIGFIAGFVLLFLFAQFILQVNFMHELDVMLNESMDMSEQLLDRFGIAGQSGDTMELMRKQMASVLDLIPVSLAFIAIMAAFLTQWVSYKVINRVENKKMSFPPFRTLRFPAAVIWVYFAALIFTFFELDEGGVLYLAIVNILALAGIFMTIQGLSFIFFYADHKSWSKAIPVTSVVLTLLLPFLVLYFVRILGIIDIGFGLRDRLRENKK